MTVKPISYSDHARISIQRHMILGQAKGLSEKGLADYCHKNRLRGAYGFPLDVFEAQLRIALYPPKPRKKTPRARDLPGQTTMFGIEPLTKKPKK